MKILAIETSTALGSIAVAKGGKILGFDSSNNPKTHTEFVNLAIEKLLKKLNISLSEIDLFAVGSGPGSFTGLRVAANIVKTFSMLHLKPLVQMDSLALLREEAILVGEDNRQFLSALNAHKNMLYISGFLEESAVAPTALTIPELETLVAKTPGPVLGLGDGFKVYEKQFSQALKNKILFPKTPIAFPSAQVLALKALDLFNHGQTIDWKSYKPLYIRASEAEEKIR
jgi:tRNA threonylcarbamoyladenosine biosynthesis protein TsaB